MINLTCNSREKKQNAYYSLCKLSILYICIWKTAVLKFFSQSKTLQNVYIASIIYIGEGLTIKLTRQTLRVCLGGHFYSVGY